MKNPLKWIFSFGVDATLPPIEKVRVELFNFGHLVIALSALAKAVDDIYDGASTWKWTLLPLFLSILNFYLNSRKQYLLVRYFTTFVFPLYVLWLFYLLGGNHYSVGFVYFNFAIAALIAYDKPGLIAINILYISLLIFVCLLYFSLFRELKASHDPIDLVINTVGAIFAITFGMYRFVAVLKATQMDLQEQRDQLFEKNEKLNQTLRDNQSKTELLSVIAHDLQGPLFSFRKITQNLSYVMRKNDPSKIQALAAHYEQSGEPLIFYMENLLNWVISQKENFQINKLTFPPDAILHAAEQNLKYAFLEKNICFHQDVPGCLTLYSDPNMLKVILVNLLHNAIKFTPAGSTISACVAATETGCVIKIRDQGPGMNPALLSMLNMEHQLPMKVDSKNHGLGLQICTRFSQLLGISMQFENETTGLAVTLMLPAPGKPLQDDIPAAAVLNFG